MTEEMKKLQLLKSSRSKPQQILKDYETESLDTVSLNIVYLTFFDDKFRTKVGFILNILQIIFHSR